MPMPDAENIYRRRRRREVMPDAENICRKHLPATNRFDERLGGVSATEEGQCFRAPV